MWLELTLIKKGAVTVDAMLAAVKKQQMGRLPLGRLAMLRGCMKLAEVGEVLRTQADDPRSFGQLAVEMGFLTQDELGSLLWLQKCQERPLGDILVEMGCLSRERLEFERAEACSQLTACFESREVEEPLVGV